MSCAKLITRFRGSMVGAVIGDCIGACFEMNDEECTKSNILKTIAHIENVKAGKRRKFGEYIYTDDTAMARSVAESLIDNKGFNAKDMAKRFSEEYMREPRRGYGGNVITVFKLLQDPQLEDVFEPARRQFDGQGSFGNGGAMRIVPAPLFSYNKDIEFLQNLTRQITEITHSHYQAIQGTILESLAIYIALHTDNTIPLDTDHYLQQLKKHMNTLEEEGLAQESEKNDKPYCYKLDKMKEYLEQEEVSIDELNEVLGNDVSALGSVPAAIYSFLRSSKPFTDELEDRNGFEKTIIYAISMKGDTDTIASMAGAIAGAYYGIKSIPDSWQHSCEGAIDASKYADKLIDISEELK
ncbi:hypothetical protein LOTGIDRAFT_117396 [Lottia gigantea]|uniref:ADP-ribosylhydrolase ARH3 n=1 Tax=Lottia gigantea TaxID=225164 RepID=V4AMY1_LOTGI|nr:hypothetical protein LOTGIDRAFT_117396 [Lottia gigantea]ESO94966.1 hypothetical protein LOTGIDRAFT_117396 [Lottia gigantea]